MTGVGTVERGRMVWICNSNYKGNSWLSLLWLPGVHLMPHVHFWAFYKYAEQMKVPILPSPALEFKCSDVKNKQYKLSCVGNQQKAQLINHANKGIERFPLPYTFSTELCFSSHTWVLLLHCWLLPCCGTGRALAHDMLQPWAWIPASVILQNKQRWQWQNPSFPQSSPEMLWAQKQLTNGFPPENAHFSLLQCTGFCLSLWNKFWTNQTHLLFHRFYNSA